MLPSEFVKNFIIGSSFPAVIISLLYIGRAYNKTTGEGTPDPPIPFTYIAWVVPILFGLTNAFFGGPAVSRSRMVLVGVIFGFVLANIGTYVYSMPTKIFGFSEERKFIPMMIAPIMYGLIWGVVVYETNQLAR